MTTAISEKTPPAVIKFIDKKFNQKHFLERKKKEGISFDLVRTSVNLVVASALIALGTSLKLPLSTTYVTFMVAMGSSLADRAWGRDSAVYRISGVITVIGGWFFTAVSAFTVSLIMAYIIHLGGLVTILLLIAFIVFLLFKSFSIHKKRETEKVLTENKELLGIDVNGENILASCKENVINTISEIARQYERTINGLVNFKRKTLSKVLNEIEDLEKDIKFLKNSLPKIIVRLQEEEIESGHHYVQVLDYLRETVNSIARLSRPIYNYLDNNHKPLQPDQKQELNELKNSIGNFFKSTVKILEEEGFKNIDKIVKEQQNLLESITKINRRQLKRIKNQESGTKNSSLYLNLMGETKNLLLFTVNLIKAQRDFLIHTTRPVAESEPIAKPIIN